MLESRDMVLYKLRKQNAILQTQFKAQQKIMEEYNTLHNLWRDVINTSKDDVVNHQYNEFRIRYDTAMITYKEVLLKLKEAMISIEDYYRENEKGEKDGDADKRG
jgi:hypothetical protein